MSNIDELEMEIELYGDYKHRKSKHYEYSSKLKKKVKEALDELEENHDSSWALEMYTRNKNNLNAIALFYRGNKITYEKMFSSAFAYAKSLKKMGYNENSEIPVCMSNIPEFVYMFLAVNMIGARINVVGSWFNKDYLLDIINKTGSKTIFISDDEYDNLKDIISESNIEKICMF